MIEMHSFFVGVKSDFQYTVMSSSGQKVTLFQTENAHACKYFISEAHFCQ